MERAVKSLTKKDIIGAGAYVLVGAILLVWGLAENQVLVRTLGAGFLIGAVPGWIMLRPALRSRRRRSGRV
ncbi:hypothetical protein AS850_14015 [Frondihabitans sp. 762G35]|nr:hypothetical protein AS850_14015 [Frondihabitans sp. 762G35]